MSQIVQLNISSANGRVIRYRGGKSVAVVLPAIVGVMKQERETRVRLNLKITLECATALNGCKRALRQKVSRRSDWMAAALL